MAGAFDPAKYKDTYTEEVQKLIEAKAKGQKRRVPPPKPAKSNVIDLVSALQESLGSVKKGKNAPPPSYLTKIDRICDASLLRISEM